MDADLKRIRGALRGNRRDADALVSRYYDEIYVFCYRQLGSKDDTLDLTQDIFIAVMETLHSYDRRKASFRTWLYHIATHKVIDHRRKQRPLTVPLDELELPNDFDKRLEQSVYLAEVEDALSAEDTELQQIFRLHLCGGYSFPEIAEMLGKPESAVKSRYYRLLTWLRKEFGDHEHPDAHSR